MNLLCQQEKRLFYINRAPVHRNYKSKVNVSRSLTRMSHVVFAGQSKMISNVDTPVSVSENGESKCNTPRKKLNIYFEQYALT